MDLSIFQLRVGSFINCKVQFVTHWLHEALTSIEVFLCSCVCVQDWGDDPVFPVRNMKVNSGKN